eukprot:4700904-Amphidinium_carterae.1
MVCQVLMSSPKCAFFAMRNYAGVAESVAPPDLCRSLNTATPCIPVWCRLMKGLSERSARI